eukprot:scaffold165353_cov29-Tisochrysis_lutea.AAC.4
MVCSRSPSNTLPIEKLGRAGGSLCPSGTAFAFAAATNAARGRGLTGGLGGCKRGSSMVSR